MPYQSHSQYDAHLALAVLIPVRDGADDLASVLLINTAMRAYAQLGAPYHMSEPNWQSWADQITGAERLPVLHLIRPDIQSGAQLISAHFGDQEVNVMAAYGRAFHQELLSAFPIYDAFFAAHRVDDQVRSLLQARCAHEALLAQLDAALARPILAKNEPCALMQPKA